LELEEEEVVCRSTFARTHYLYNPVTREVLPLNCKSWRCPLHQKSWLHKWRAIASFELKSHPVDRLATLTCASECSPEQLVLAKQLLFRELRKEYGKIDYFSVLEFTTKSRLPHLHLLLRCDYINQRILSRKWLKSTTAAGIKPSPIVYIEKPRSQSGSALYALKYALSGAEKDQAIPDSWRGRKITYSKEFFHASTSSIWQEVLRTWLGDKYSADKSDWHLLPDIPPIPRSLLISTSDGLYISRATGEIIG